MVLRAWGKEETGLGSRLATSAIVQAAEGDCEPGSLSGSHRTDGRAGETGWKPGKARECLSRSVLGQQPGVGALGSPILCG